MAAGRDVSFISSVRCGVARRARGTTCLGTGEAGAWICVRRAFRLGVAFGCYFTLPRRRGVELRESSRAEAEHRGDAGALHFCVA